MTRRKPAPETEPDDDYGYAVREMLTEALAVLPPTAATGIVVQDLGGDILRFSLDGETVLMVDRPTIAARVAAIRRRRAVGHQ